MIKDETENQHTLILIFNLEIMASEIVQTRFYLDFVPLREEWNKYRLEDGSIIRIKLILTKLFESPKESKKITNDFSTQIELAYVPSILLRKPNPLQVSKAELDVKDNIEKKYVGFETLTEDWNEYQITTLDDEAHLLKGGRLKAKYSLRVIRRSKFSNKYGEPIYNITGGVEATFITPNELL